MLTFDLDAETLWTARDPANAERPITLSQGRYGWKVGAGLTPLPRRTAYCASKAGMVMLAKALAIEAAEVHVRVNAVCPGIVDTPMFRASWEGAPNPAAELETIKAHYAMRRVRNRSRSRGRSSTSRPTSRRS